MTRSILAFLVLFGAAPVLSDPARPEGAAAGCWSPGGAPALFSWSGTPGIACRDLADAAAPRDTMPAAPAPAQNPGSTGGPAEVTFSGSAYFGVAVAF